nr:hypothetical protein Iba_chr04bCG4600 [Ipomoea batatas]
MRCGDEGFGGEVVVPKNWKQKQLHGWSKLWKLRRPHHLNNTNQSENSDWRTMYVLQSKQDGVFKRGTISEGSLLCKICWKNLALLEEVEGERRRALLQLKGVKKQNGTYLIILLLLRSYDHDLTTGAGVLPKRPGRPRTVAARLGA